MKPVWYVYYSTRGAAGQYVHALQGAAKEAGVSTRAFVSASYRFPTPRVVRWFFPITDRTEKRSRAIKLIRAAELAVGYAGILCAAAIARPRINLSLNDDNALTYLFFRGCKLAGLKVDLTCHDVVSHHGGAKQRRFTMMAKADRLVVHSPNARQALMDRLGPDSERRIVEYGFPCAAVSEIVTPESVERARNHLRESIGEGGYFLSIGVVRQSKGIDALLDAWEQCSSRSSAKLVIAGKWDDPPDETRERAKHLDRCVLIDRYLTDDEFVALIEDARFVVLPYLEYTHSEVLFACAAHNAPVIVSDAPLFDELLPDYELTCKRNDAGSLAAAIDRAWSMTESDRDRCARILREAYEGVQARLVEEIKVAYGS